jgi:hypothetical protein
MAITVSNVGQVFAMQGLLRTQMHERGSDLTVSERAALQGQTHAIRQADRQGDAQGRQAYDDYKVLLVELGGNGFKVQPTLTQKTDRAAPPRRDRPGC